MNENHTSLSPSPQRTGKVLLIYTGGTIGMGRNPKTDALEPLDFSHLASKLPEFQYLKTSIETCQFGEPVDSSDIDPQIWARIVNIITKNCLKELVCRIEISQPAAHICNKMH